jgi:hypothetical protein
MQSPSLITNRRKEEVVKVREGRMKKGRKGKKRRKEGNEATHVPQAFKRSFTKRRLRHTTYILFCVSQISIYHGVIYHQINIASSPTVSVLPLQGETSLRLHWPSVYPAFLSHSKSSENGKTVNLLTWILLSARRNVLTL